MMKMMKWTKIRSAAKISAQFWKIKSRENASWLR